MKTAADVKIIVYPRDRADDPMVRRFLALGGVQHIPYETQEDCTAVMNECEQSGIASREVVALRSFMGRHVQKCPGSPSMICCNYRVFNMCFNCLYNCTYCYLHDYINAYGIHQFLDLEPLYGGIARMIAETDMPVVRAGPGEYTDSLMMDDLTGTAARLIGIAADNPRLFLELKTKSDRIDHLLGIERKGNTVMAWSMNTPSVVDRHEEGTANLERRIAAAGQAAESGYYTAFHFDPIVIYPGCEREYRDVVARLRGAVNPESVLWVSMGGFRCTPGFYHSLLSSGGKHRELVSGEMFPGPDGKMRYLKSMRVDMYRMMKRELEAVFPGAFIYMCMETADVWAGVFERKYASSDELEREMVDMLAARVKTR